MSRISSQHHRCNGKSFQCPSNVTTFRGYTLLWASALLSFPCTCYYAPILAARNPISHLRRYCSFICASVRRHIQTRQSCGFMCISNRFACAIMCAPKDTPVTPVRQPFPQPTISAQTSTRTHILFHHCVIGSLQQSARRGTACSADRRAIRHSILCRQIGDIGNLTYVKTYTMCRNQTHRRSIAPEPPSHACHDIRRPTDMNTQQLQVAGYLSPAINLSHHRPIPTAKSQNTPCNAPPCDPSIAPQPGTIQQPPHPPHPQHAEM